MADRVDTSADLGLDLGARRALEDGHVHVADRDHTPLVAEGDEPVQLVHLEGRVRLLVEVDRDRDEAHVDEVLVDLVRRPADVDRGADLLCPEVVHEVLVVGRHDGWRLRRLRRLELVTGRREPLPHAPTSLEG